MGILRLLTNNHYLNKGKNARGVTNVITIHDIFPCFVQI